MRRISTNFRTVLICPISVIGVLFSLLINTNLLAFNKKEATKKGLTIHFSGDAKIEVGSYYAGLEFHHSYPVPQRFSFYYPVANSIDLSTDYWKRDTTFVTDVGLKFGESKIEWLNNKPFTFDLTPFSVDFIKEDNDKKIELSYAFTKNKPALVINYSIINKTNREKTVELYIKQALAFKTSHTYKLSENIYSKILKNGEAIFINHDDFETQNACMFIVNGNEQPLNVQFVDRKSGSKDFFRELLAKRKFVNDPRSEVKLITDIKGILQLIKTARLSSALSLPKQAFMIPMNLTTLLITLKRQCLPIRATLINQEERSSNQKKYLMES